MRTSVQKCLQVCRNMYKCVQICASMYKCVLMFEVCTIMYKCVQICTSMYKCGQVSKNTCKCVQVHAHM
jgi:hypothetical protein